jgi:hypothetical protein
MAPSSAPSLKRRHASPELSDSENVDPNIFESIKKRKHSSVDDDVSISKPQRYSLTTISSKPRPAIPTLTPRLNTTIKPSTTPASAPPAAGRSPTKPKSNGILNARRRFAPPSFGHTKSPSLSLIAALKGTVASKKARAIPPSTIEESQPKSWFFDIYEESEEQQDYTINEWNMTQSATILDISDAESKAKNNSDRGKENVDPNEVSAPVTRSMAATASTVKAQRVTRKDMMTDEPRTPLGDLDASDYYGEGLDATSVVLVQDDVAEPIAVKEKAVEEAFIAATPAVEIKQSAFTFNASTSEKMTAVEVGALLMASEAAWDTETLISSPVDGPAEDGGIEIWESESAKDEAEEKENVFALAEL